MLKIWGRADGSNVIKAMWCIGELAIEHERIDWGGEFGGNDDPQYRRKNPNGRLPTLEEEDGWTLWESGAVVRYLCTKYGLGNLWACRLLLSALADDQGPDDDAPGNQGREPPVGRRSEIEECAAADGSPAYAKADAFRRGDRRCSGD